MSEQRIIVIGDELVAGTGDPKRLGWVGRVMNRTPMEGRQHVLTLAMPAEGTKGLSERFSREVVPRLARKVDNRVVVGLGVHDVAGAGVSAARSRLHLANILDEAHNAGASTFVVGPPPIPGVDAHDLSRFARACSEVCARRKVPFVDAFTPLVEHDQWLTDMAAGDGRLPGQAGYGLLAWLVLHRGWVSWLLGDRA